MRATIKRPARRCNEQQALPHEDLMASFHDAEHVISQTVQKRTKSLNLHNNGPSERFNNRDTVATVDINDYLWTHQNAGLCSVTTLTVLFQEAKDI